MTNDDGSEPEDGGDQELHRAEAEPTLKGQRVCLGADPKTDSDSNPDADE
jgi:hypothetical protein